MSTALAMAHWSDTVTLGSTILAIVIGVTALAVLAYGTRWRAAYLTEKAVADSLKEGREAYQLRSDRLEEQLTEALRLVGEHAATIARLEGLPDLSSIEELIGRVDEAATKRTIEAIREMEQLFEGHERRAEERHTQLMQEVVRR